MARAGRAARGALGWTLADRDCVVGRDAALLVWDVEGGQPATALLGWRGLYLLHCQVLLSLVDDLTGR
jgi:hypothetical protein